MKGRALMISGVATLAAVAVLSVGLLSHGNERRPRPQTCVSTSSLIALHAFARLVRRPIDCAVLFIDATPTWPQWVQPWFLGYHRRWAKFDWVSWYRSGHGRRRLILTVDLIPTTPPPNWLQDGAAGLYAGYARQLATNLVRAGLGAVIIRLAHEANGTAFRDSLGTTPAELQRWVSFWRQTVRAMRSVPGAQFKFDWCVNAGYRPIPLTSFYPGDRYVDDIGVDAYDSSPNHLIGTARLPALLAEPDGLYAVAAFARAHHKPLSISEWGVGPPGLAGAGGDDPAYIDAVAGVVHSGGVDFQAYFFSGTWGAELQTAPRSLSAYQHAFARSP